MNSKICRYSRRLALTGAVAALAAGCSVGGDPAVEPAGGLFGVVPWNHAHPILVNFTAGLVPASLVSDLLGKAGKFRTLSSAGWWTMMYAALLTPATALTGWYWKAAIPAEVLPADLIVTHTYLGIALAMLFAVLAIWRAIIFSRDALPGTGYLLTAGTTVALLVYQGSLGGKMVFG